MNRQIADSSRKHGRFVLTSVSGLDLGPRPVIDPVTVRQRAPDPCYRPCRRLHRAEAWIETAPPLARHPSARSSLQSVRAEAQPRLAGSRRANASRIHTSRSATLSAGCAGRRTTGGVTGPARSLTEPDPATSRRAARSTHPRSRRTSDPRACHQATSPRLHGSTNAATVRDFSDQSSGNDARAASINMLPGRPRLRRRATVDSDPHAFHRQLSPPPRNVA